MNKRASVCAALFLLAAPKSGAAQQAAGWAISGSVAQTWFSHAATGESTDFGPSPGLTVGVGFTRHFAKWEASLVADNAPSVLRASDSVSVLQISALSFGRTGLAFLLGRTLSRAGSASVIAGAGVRLDAWSLPEEEHRWRAGGEVHAALRFDAGALAIENRLTVGLSGSPFDAADLPGGYRRETLKWMEVGLGVRVGL
ncbi:MAG TPA: hypothetical protein VFI41_00490 [Gemmatimonadales bacterium]|jgi:hypothetical protein|nr:hypothetical protein [Gemmatimonadales bacterium]